ncbi:hypothetical protein Tco_1201596 [Tanacetum coccineum]
MLMEVECDINLDGALNREEFEEFVKRLTADTFVYVTQGLLITLAIAPTVAIATKRTTEGVPGIGKVVQKLPTSVYASLITLAVMMIQKADIKVLNYILQGIPNDIYNSVDACQDAQAMWKRVKRLMQGTNLSERKRHLRLMNEFDKFSAEASESLTYVYEKFSTLVNNMDRNKIKPNKIALNTKFLNSLQPEWSKYVTLARQTHKLKEDHFDRLYDYLSQCEPHVNASRAKRNARNHDQLALVANSYTNPSYSHANHSYSYASLSYSRSLRPYYVTHPPSIHDYDDDYQREIQGDAQKDKPSTAMMLLARAITQHFSTPTNNRLRTSSNTRNQADIQDGRMLLAAKYEAKVHVDTKENDFMLMSAYGDDQLEELNALVIMMARIQPTDNESDAEPTYDGEVISELNASQINLINGLLSKEVNGGQLEHDQDAHDQNFAGLESLINNVQVENIEKLEKEKDELQYQFLKAKSESLNVKNETKSIKKAFKLKEDKYLEDIVMLGEKLKYHERDAFKMSHSLQTLHMRATKPNSFYDPNMKTSLGYQNPERLKKAMQSTT